MLILGLCRRYPKLHRLVHRDRYRSCPVCRFVWWRLTKMPGFRAAMAQISVEELT